ncbi:battenin CLN3 protein [Oleoguttula mirabilis]|uniref:Protein BTN n=1 Tax=Oleoguttula mirabilis TaxID=1507867 RepID=A0AAV9JSC3_9PEZI|nr:battenin CLN3 protein [Oleoguttula mirabilis]
MLPMPGAPSTTWSHYTARMKAALEGADLRVCVAFWLFGLINNIFYVIILSSALDLVGPSIPKATVLLASIIPGLATKLVVPYIIHLVPYSLRIVIFATLSTCGMLVVALSPSGSDAKSVAAKVAGIVLANMSSGAGEVNFLALTHFYGTQSLAAWGSGTGGAGLIGAGAYALATTTLGFSVHATLLASAVVPLGMILSFFALLPRGPLKAAGVKGVKYRSVTAEDEQEGEAAVDGTEEHAGLLDQTCGPSTASAYSNTQPWSTRSWSELKVKLLRTRSLVVPYMLPLFLVYAAEYTINQGVAPTLLFPLDQSPFKHYRAFYPTYGAIYQLGVFISRSSLPFFRVRSLYTPTFFQVANLVALTAQALFPYLPTVWFVFAIIFWEGLLGGLVYVSTFAAIREEVPEEDREFSLGATTVSDSGGIFVAGLLGVAMESLLCSWQVRHGRDWCRRL